MLKMDLENSSLVVWQDARYDLTVFGPDDRTHHVTGHLPPNIRDVSLARGVFQQLVDGVLRLHYPETETP